VENDCCETIYVAILGANSGSRFKSLGLGV